MKHAATYSIDAHSNITMHRMPIATTLQYPFTWAAFLRAARRKEGGEGEESTNGANNVRCLRCLVLIHITPYVVQI